MSHQIYRIAFVFLFTLGLFTGNTETFASVPPHPRIAKLLKEKKINTPYYLKNRKELLKRGVNAPWASPSIQKQSLSKQIGIQRSFGAASSPHGSWKALVLLVQFTDKAQNVNPAMFDSLLFGNSARSLRDYYKAVSYNNLDIVTVNMPSSVGWNMASQTYSYYVNGQNGLGAYPQNAQKLVEDVLAVADSSVDYSKYDNDGDGYVDALFVIHTGPGAEFTGNDADIWSHEWNTVTPQLRDGVYLYKYSMEPEYWEIPGDMTCGVFAHELGHTAFGLPDLYDNDYSSEGLGNWTLMAGGSWNGASGLGEVPAFPDAWSHFQMGFLSPTNVTSNLFSQNIHNVENAPEAFRLWTDGSIGNEYFLVQNRQQVGYDSYLPGSGLLVYHVDESVPTGNDNEWYPGHASSGHYFVALEQADGLYGLEKKIDRGNVGDPFPGSTVNRDITSSTLPNSNTYPGTATQIRITNISNSSTTMTADLQVKLVTGMPSIAVSPDTVHSGLVAIGNHRDDTVFVKNVGTENLVVHSITSTLTQYTPSTTSFTVSAGERQPVVLMFSPTDSISYHGTLTITCNDTAHGSVQVVLMGKGTYAPAITVAPDSFMVTIAQHDSTMRTMTIGNLGSRLLNWTAKVKMQSLASSLFSNVHNASNTMVKVYKGLLDQHGIINKSDPYPVRPLESRLTDNSNAFPTAQTLLESTPLFGINASGLHQINPLTGGIIRSLPLSISSGGPHGLCYDGAYIYFIDGYGINKIVRIDPVLLSVIDTLAVAFPGDIDGLATNGTSVYALDYSSSVVYEVDLSSRSIVNTLSFGLSIGGGLTYAAARNSFFISNFCDAIYEIDASDGHLINTLTPPICAYGVAYSNSSNVLFVGDYGSQTRVLDPATGVTLSSFSGGYDALASDETFINFISLDPVTGAVAPGVTQSVSVKFNAKYLLGGDYQSVISITSNDPVQSFKNVPAHLHVIGVPSIEIKTDTLRFGIGFVGMMKTDTIKVRNTGRELLLVSSVSSSSSIYTPNITSFTVPVRGMQPVVITFAPTDTVAYNGTLTILSNDTSQGSVYVGLTGRGAYVPVSSVAPSSLHANLFTGQSTTQSLTISNTGAGDLRFDATLGFGVSASTNKSPAVKTGASFSSKSSIQADAEYQSNQVIVKFKQGISTAQTSTMRSNIHATVAKKFSTIGAELWNLTGVSVADAIGQYKDNPLIQYIEPNYIVHAIDRTPNDPMFSQLWGMQKISAPAAWDRTTGTNIVIGDIDTGIDTNHVDLKANLWTNPGEIAGNGIDDDRNGFVDDVHGWNFVSNTNNVYDDHSHGTHTAGTIAAVGNNSVGVTGVCWSAKIMAIKFLDASGSGTTAGAIDAVEYATLMHTRLTSNSWGGGGYSLALYDAIKAAGDAGALFVAAAGNSSMNTDVYLNYPSCYDLDNIISVASTTSSDGLSSFSNYGLVTVDLGAPGSDILSTLPGNSYGMYSGTSMATPHVSGVAGLVLSLNPMLSFAEVKNIILSSVDPIASLTGKTVTGGRLNAEHALRNTPSWIKLNPLSGTVTPGTSVNLTVTFDAAGMNGGDYQSTIIIHSNDPLHNPKEVPVTMHVTGRPVIAVTPDTVKSGIGFIGMTKYDTMRVQNTGTDELVVSNVSSSLTVYRPSITSFTVPVGGMQAVVLSFAPTDTISYDGRVTITSNDSIRGTVNIVLKGRGAHAPVLTVVPDSLAVAIAQDDSTVRTLTIGNTGLGNLSWNITSGFAAMQDARLKSRTETELTAIQQAQVQGNNSGAATVSPYSLETLLTSSGTMRVLLWTAYSDNTPGGEAENTMNAIRLYKSDVAFDTTKTQSPVLFASRLAQADVFIVPEQENISDLTAIGSAFSSALTSFVQSGRTIIVMDYFNIGSTTFLNATGLLTIANVSPQSSLTAVVHETSSPLVAGVSATFTGMNGVNYHSSPNGRKIIRDQSSGNNVVTQRDMSAGRVIYIGMDFYSYNADMARVLANAVISSQNNKWLSVQPNSGTVLPGTTQDVTVKFNGKDLQPGKYRTNIVMTSNDPVHTPKNVPTYLTINDIRLISPNGGENWQYGSNQNITWTLNATRGNVRIEYSTNNGSSWSDIITSTPDDGTYPWTIPNKSSTACLVRVSDTDGHPTDQSDAMFTISEPPGYIGDLRASFVNSRILLEWSPVPGAVGYNVYRGTQYDFVPDAGRNQIAANILDEAPGTPGIQWTDPSATVVGDTTSHHFWRIFGLCVNTMPRLNRQTSQTSIITAGINHTVTGKVFNSDHGIPGDSAIQFEAYIVSRTGEVLNEAAVGCGYSSGYWFINTGSLPTAWSIGDTLHVDVRNVVNNQLGQLNLLLTGSDPDNAPDLNLSTIVEFGVSNVAGEFTYPLHSTPGTDINEIVVGMDTRTTRNPILDAENLAHAIPYCTTVYSWNAQGQGFVGHVKGLPFNNFPVHQGYPYAVNVPKDTVWTVAGCLTDTNYHLITTPGTDINHIAIPFSKSHLVNADSLIRDIPGGTTVYYWSAIAQATIGHVKGLSFNNFPVIPRYPYYANVTRDSVWPSVPLAVSKPIAFGDFSIKNLKGGSKSASTLSKETSSEEINTAATSMRPSGGVPHIVYGKHNARISGGIKMRVWITSRSGEVLNESSVGTGCDSIYWWANIGVFPTSWKKGETLKIELEDSTTKMEGKGSINLTNDGSDCADLINLDTPVQTLGIEHDGSDIPKEFSLVGNYPNPFNPTTTIVFRLPENSEVTIEIFDIIGRLVKTFYNGTQKPGEYLLSWDGTNDNGLRVSSGVYFYKMKANTYVCSKKMLLIK